METFAKTPQSPSKQSTIQSIANDFATNNTKNDYKNIQEY